jgi:DNA-directed RNA polymerase specialized sigma24 family protein
MTERGRLVLDLKFDADLPTKAIADKLGLTVAVVNMTVFRAKKVLFDCIRRTLAGQRS